MPRVYNYIINMSKTRSLVSKVSINKYDPFQLKGALDDELTYLLEEEKGF